MMKNIFILLFTIFLFSDTVSHAQCNHAQDYAALRELYLATGGDNWTNNSGWPDSTIFINNPTLPVGTDMSSWYGVDCKNGRVDALNLSYNNLEGALPTLQLDSLRFIHLTNNQLSGTVPNFNFPIIRELELSFNGLVGQIPDFQFVSDTVYLYLDNNNLSGCFPESLKRFCGIDRFSSANNPLLPWEGDIDQFCATDGSHTAQIGAPCRNGSQDDVIKDDCSCGDCLGPINDQCGTAFDVGTGFNPIQITGSNVCALTGGSCIAPENESAVFFTYTVPDEGLTSLEIRAPGFFVSASSTCGGGTCEENSTVLNCPDPGSIIYITLSSSEVNEGNYLLTIRPQYDAPPITGRVFVDSNLNGSWDSDVDLPLSLVEIYAYPDCDIGQPPISVMTDDKGNFTFEGMLPGSPATRYLILLNPTGGVGCNSGVAECVELDPCVNKMDPILFPCPPPDCTSNPYSVDNICQTALDNPLCDLRVIQEWPCGQNPTKFGPWLNQSQCSGGGVYHNTSFYGFVAGSGSYDINFTIFACAGSGVQYGILDGVCDPGGPCVVYSGAANTGTVTISSSLLTPCKTYVFWIDGFSASVCRACC